jgi:hypothetical protein
MVFGNFCIGVVGELWGHFVIIGKVRRRGGWDDLCLLLHDPFMSKMRIKGIMLPGTSSPSLESCHEVTEKLFNHSRHI